jgi:hypothetical protein
MKKPFLGSDTLEWFKLAVANNGPNPLYLLDYTFNINTVNINFHILQRG